jgi:hypothetical protein
MQKLGLIWVTALLLIPSSIWAATLKCGIGSDSDKLEYVRTGEIKRGQKSVTVRFEDSNRYNLRYYQAKVYLDYKAEGDTDKDVVELILSPRTGVSAISSQKVSSLEGGEAFAVFLVKSSTSFLQLLCVIEDELTIK